MDGSGSEPGSSSGVPVRTCIGCRVRGPRDRMTRIVAGRDDVPDVAATPGVPPVRVIVDVRRVLPGRGAWLHAECVGRALRQRAVSRALRIAGELDTTALQAWAADQAETAVSDRREGSGLEADGHPMSPQR